MTDKIEIEITADDSASGVFDKLGGSMGGLASIAGGVLTAGLAAGAAGLAALGTGLGIAISEALDAQLVLAQTESVIASTGGVAGMTADEVGELASALSEVTRFSGDAIQAGENMLLTFTQIGEDVFPEATQTMLDMATAMGGDLQGAAIQLGKALNDPITGISALSRVGVTFTEDQKAMIAAMVEAGDVAGAQRLILEELNREFGGSAEAAGATAAGQWDIFKNQMLDIAEGIGLSLLPALTDVGQMVGGELMGAVEAIAPIFEDIGRAFNGFTSGIEGGLTPLDAFSRQIRRLFPREIAADINEIAGVVFGFIDLISAGDISGALNSIFPPILTDSIMNLIDSFGDLGMSVASTFPQMQASGQSFLDWLPVMIPVVAQVIDNVANAVRGLAAIWVEIAPVVIPAVTIIAELIVAAFGGVVAFITGFITTIVQLLQGDFVGALTTVVETVSFFANSVSTIFGSTFPEVLAAWTGIWDNFLLIVTTIWERINAAITGKIVEISTMVVAKFEDIVAQILGFRDRFFDIGTNLIAGLIEGVQSMLQLLQETISNAVNGAIQAGMDAAGIQSPSKVTMQMGQFLMQGLAEGISGSAGLPQIAAAGAMGGAIQSMQMSPGGAGVPGGTRVLNFYYQPAMSLGNEEEAKAILAPVIADVMYTEDNR